MEEGQDEHTNSYSVPVQLRIPFGMNETLTCAWAMGFFFFTAIQHLLVSRYVLKKKKKKSRNVRTNFFHQAMPRVAWLSQSFPFPSSKQLRAPVHREDTLREDSTPLCTVLMQNTIPRPETDKQMFFLCPTMHLS